MVAAGTVLRYVLPVASSIPVMGDGALSTLPLPRLDLANASLLRAHIHALWLAHIGLPLGQSIEQMTDTTRDELPLRTRIAHHIQLGDVDRAALLMRARFPPRRRAYPRR